MNVSRNRISSQAKSLKKLSPHRLSLYKQYFLSLNENNSKLLITPKTKSKSKKISLSKVFKEPEHKRSPEKLWPKLTKPKLPFSNKYDESDENKKIKIRLQKPSKTLHDFHTVKWLRNKYSDSVVEKSVLSLLPEKSKNIPEIYKEDKEKNIRYQKMKDFLNSFKGPFGREKTVEINPKYLFNESTFDKILKLKEIFLEFDQRKTQTMEFDEILNMFNKNHIKADKNDIAELFFKGKKIKKKEDMTKLNLGFFQFIHFALKKEQNFKEFMRKIREKNQKNLDKENIYLPMNFNLIMDYFINKEKERHSINNLKKAVDILENDIKINEQEKSFTFNESEISENNSMIKNQKKNKIKNQKIEKNVLSDINILDLYNDFIKLFRLISNTQIPKRNSLKYSYQNNIIPIELDNKNAYKKTNLFLYNTFNSNMQKNKGYKSLNKTADNNNPLLHLIKKEMNKNTIKNLKMKNYNKYHDINLAREATIDKIRDNIKFHDNIILDKIDKNKNSKKIIEIE